MANLIDINNIKEEFRVNISKKEFNLLTINFSEKDKIELIDKSNYKGDLTKLILME